MSEGLEEIKYFILKYGDLEEYIDAQDFIGDPEEPKDIELMKNLKSSQEETLKQIIKKCKELEE